MNREYIGFIVASSQRRIGMALIRAALLLLTASVPVATALAAEVLNLGMVDPSPSKMSERFTPLLNYLNAKGISTGKVVTTKTTEEMTARFDAGDVQFMFESPYGALEAMDGAGARPILIREKGGVRQYNSVIFVNKDSAIHSLPDLLGKVVAFEDPGSTSSFHMPKRILEGAGLALVESRKPIAEKIAYYFSKDDLNTIVQVKAGRVAQAGGIKTNKVQGKPNFRLLEPQSSSVPRHVVLVHKDIDSSQLKAVLLGMKNDPEAQAVLQKIKTPTGFSEFDGDPVTIMNTTVRAALGG